MPDTYICEITNIARLAGESPAAKGFAAFSIAVKCGRMASEARAGQFMHVKCGEGTLLRRPFGICRVRGDELTFVFELKGEGTLWLSCRKQGEQLDILGPLGNGYDIPEGRIIVAGGGLGAPPLLFAAESARGAATAVLGFRESGMAILASEFEEACEKVYLTTDDGSLGIHGLVTKPLEELLKNGGYGAVLSCGPTAMQIAVAKLCEKYGVPCQASLEGRMGCGVGACLVCACATKKDGRDQMSRVCRDGPVFNAAELAWSESKGKV